MKLVLLGAGGHAKSCIACLEHDDIQVLGLLDNTRPVGTNLDGYPILGTDDEISSWVPKSDGFLVTVGQIETASVRQRLFEMVTALGGHTPWLKATSAYVHRNALPGPGTIVMHRAFVNAGASIGSNCILNTGSIIEHDSVVGSHVHVSTGAIVNGGCRIGDCCFIGSGAVLRNGVAVAPGVVVGAGSVVVNDLGEPGVYVGNPARRIR